MLFPFVALKDAPYARQTKQINRNASKKGF